MKLYRTNWYFDWTNADEYNMYALSKERLEDEVRAFLVGTNFGGIEDNYRSTNNIPDDQSDETIDGWYERPLDYLEDMTDGDAYGYIEEIEVME